MKKIKLIKKKRPVVLRYSEEEAGLLFELLHSEMEELMHLNTLDRLSEKPIIDQEQRDHLHRAMQFCAEQMKKLQKYARL